MDVRDAHYEQCKWMVKAWREAHKHEHFSSTTTDHFAIDSSRNDSVPLGFTRGLRTETGDPEPIEPDEDDKRRRIRK
jgi:hypothetical protein